jgi:methylase of polypeptide subunit release factors
MLTKINNKFAFSSIQITKMNPYVAIHLLETERIKLGAFYTPSHIVQKVFELVYPYYISHKNNAVIVDLAAGCGAFLFPILSLGADYRVADCDPKSITFLKNYFANEKIFYTNSLKQVSRAKFNIREDQFLIVVGNPPYNDTTSLYRKNEKGFFDCDPDLYDRDIGISFLKAFAKLKADVICVLHPLSYLIKEANFKRLKRFKEMYRLKNGYIFSSAEFFFTKIAKFPIIIALYEKNLWGMDYEYIKNFKFKFLDREEEFILKKWTTTDGYINKYPPRSGEPITSPINIYFYSFRDLNSLLRNATFLGERKDNTIVVTLENFYKYAYLYCLKKFVSKMKKAKSDLWIFGNLSPLVNKDFVEKNKKLFVIYAVKTHKLFLERKDLAKKLSDFYQIGENEIDLQKIEKDLNEYFCSLYQL